MGPNGWCVVTEFYFLALQLYLLTLFLVLLLSDVRIPQCQFVINKHKKLVYTKEKTQAKLIYLVIIAL